jgi:hypothetical protein
VLALFVLEDNLDTIVAHFGYFKGINEAYQLMGDAMHRDEQWGQRFEEKGVLRIVGQKMEQEDELNWLAMDALPGFLIGMLRTTRSQNLQQLIEHLVSILERYNNGDLSRALLSATDIALLANEFSTFAQSHLKDLLSSLQEANNSSAR